MCSVYSVRSVANRPKHSDRTEHVTWSFLGVFALFVLVTWWLLPCGRPWVLTYGHDEDIFSRVHGALCIALHETLPIWVSVSVVQMHYAQTSVDFRQECNAFHADLCGKLPPLWCITVRKYYVGSREYYSGRLTETVCSSTNRNSYFERSQTLFERYCSMILTVGHSPISISWTIVEQTLALYFCLPRPLNVAPLSLRSPSCL